MDCGGAGELRPLGIKEDQGERAHAKELADKYFFSSSFCSMLSHVMPYNLSGRCHITCLEDTLHEVTLSSCETVATLVILDHGGFASGDSLLLPPFLPQSYYHRIVPLNKDWHTNSTLGSLIENLPTTNYYCCCVIIISQTAVVVATLLLLL